VFGVIALVTVITAPTPFATPSAAINLSDIHTIYCAYSGGIYQGTAFVIAKGVLATANHVTEGTHCFDATANKPVKAYKTDKRHDFALFTGNIDANGPYIKYSCQRPTPGDYYISYGWSAAGLKDFFNPILRNNVIQATNKFDTKPNDVPGFLNAVGMRYYNGAIAEGTSGGPVATMDGTVLAVNNAGTNEDTVDYDLADTGLCTGKWDA